MRSIPFHMESQLSNWSHVLKSLCSTPQALFCYLLLQSAKLMRMPNLMMRRLRLGIFVICIESNKSSFYNVVKGKDSEP